MPDHYLFSTLEVTLNMSSEGSARAYVLHYKYAPGHSVTATECAELAQNFWTAIQSSWNNLHSTGVNAESVVVKDLAGPGRAVGQYTVPQPHPGTVAGVLGPGNAAGVVSWKTGLTGRSYRGRTYLCGISDAFMVGSFFTSSWLTVAAVFANVVAAFTNSSGALSCQFCIASFTAEVATPVSAFSVNNAVDSQRRRLVGRGS